MEIRNLLINLGNPVQAFSAQSSHLELIRSSFPDTCVCVAENSGDFRRKLAEADCVLTWVFKKEWYEGAANLQAVFTPAAGHELGRKGSQRQSQDVLRPFSRAHHA
jgi:hypothetical protein